MAHKWKYIPLVYIINSIPKLQGVLLVGGFGSSAYLYKHLSATIKDKAGKGVRILQPTDA